MGQPVAWFEVISTDADRARKFYAELFGWTVSADPAIDGYALVDTGAGEGAIGGGIGQPAGSEDEPGVKIYMPVDDLDAHLDRAERLGGRRLVPPTASGREHRRQPDQCKVASHACPFRSRARRRGGR